MTRYAILGAGQQGRAVAHNLAARADTTGLVLVDKREPPDMPAGATWLDADVLSADGAARAVAHADCVVLALPGDLAMGALGHLVSLGVPVVDISFTPETPYILDSVAKQSGTCIIADVGVAPGLSHLLVGEAHRRLEGLDAARIWVGGIPLEPRAPFHHAVYFHPADLVAEYVRPARARRDGKAIHPAPLDEPTRPFHDDEKGDFEAFLSDGLRSLLSSYPDVHTLEEWTLRRPGHLDYMRGLDLADAALPAQLAHDYPAADNPDFLLMRVDAHKGDHMLSWRLLDTHDGALTAMSRTTAFTAAAVAHEIARGTFSRPGVHPPERLAEVGGLVVRIIADLAAHGVKVEEIV